MLLLAIIWGSSFILIQEALKTFYFAEVGAIRLVAAGITGLLFAGKALKKIPRNKIRHAVIYGFFGAGVPAYLFPFGQQEVESSVSGILNGLSPVFVFLIGVAIFKTPFHFGKAIGIVVAFCGGALLLLQSHEEGTSNWIYGAIIILATIFYGISSNILKVYLQQVPPVAIAAIGFSAMGLLSLPYLFVADIPKHFFENAYAWKSLAAILVLAVFGSAIAAMMFSKLVQRTTALFGASVTFIMPVIAVGWGLVAGESIGLFHAAGMLLIILGVYLISR